MRSNPKSNGLLPPSRPRRPRADPDQLKEGVAVFDSVRSDVTEALSAEAVPEVAGLARFKAQYEGLEPEYRFGCAWSEVETRLLANDGHYLRLAEAMEKGGVLFKVDKVGNPLIADGGVEPIMTGMNYADTRKAVMFAEKEGRQVPTGYELFPNSGGYEKDSEILVFKRATNEHFIRSGNKKEFRGSWLESGENPDRPWCAFFDPDYGYVRVDYGNPRISGSTLGVRRLLRVKKV